MGFSICCDMPSTIEYEIKHEPKPITFEGDVLDCIERLLWYAPEINSKQASSNELVNDHVYDEFSFSYLCNSIGLDLDKDVRFDDKLINEDDIAGFRNSLCKNCQKVILTKKPSNETRSRALLRHIRNSIAHGNFNILNGIFVSFDEDKQNKVKISTAYIRLKVTSLQKLIKMFDNLIIREKLIGFSLAKCGYSIDVESTRIGQFSFDFLASKESYRCAIEVKHMKDKDKWLRDSFLKHEIPRWIMMKELATQDGRELVLVNDGGQLTNEAKNLFSENGITMLDRDDIVKLLQGYDVLSR